MEIKVEKSKSCPENYATNLMLDCVKFWNREGEKAIEKNISGEWGSKETQEMAKTQQADDFLLEMLLCDCKGICNSEFVKNSGDWYECGRTRSHVWIHINGDRKLMFYC
jgi:hypothetical protein